MSIKTWWKEIWNPEPYQDHNLEIQKGEATLESLGFVQVSNVDMLQKAFEKYKEEQMKQQHSQSVNENDLSSWIDSEIQIRVPSHKTQISDATILGTLVSYDEIGVIISVSNNRLVMTPWSRIADITRTLETPKPVIKDTI